MKNIERGLIATGVALVLSATAGSAAIMWGNAASAAQPSADTQLAALVGNDPTSLADRGPHGGDRLTAAATYIGIPVADLRTQLASGKSLAEIAVANGKTRDGLVAALVAAEQQEISTFVDQKGLGFPGGMGHLGRGVEGDRMAVAATFLGLTTADLHTKLESGQTLAQIATAAGKSPDALIQALVADAKAKVEQAKAAGTITADQAAKIEAGLTDRMTRLVNATDGGRGPRH